MPGRNDRGDFEDDLNYTLRVAVENSSDGINITDLDGIIVYANPSAEAMYGYEPGELKGKHVEDLNSQPGVSSSHIIPAIKSKGSWVGELSQKKKNGALFSAHLSASIVIKEGKYSGMLGIIRDITERKMAEEALRLNEQNLKLAMKAGELVPWEIDLMTDEVKPSPQLLTSFGRDLQDTIRSREEWRALIHEEDRQRIFESVEAARDRNPGHHIEYRFHHPDGKIHWHESHGIVIHDMQGRAARLVGFLRDITKRKQDEDSLRKLNETLENQVAERTALAEGRARQLQVLVMELTHAEQRERRRIAHILHDHLQQLLAVARINCEILSDNLGPGHKEAADNILNLIKRSIKTTRSLAAEISPPVLQKGLSAVMEWVCRRMQEYHGLTVELHTDPFIDPQPGDVIVFLYQSARELLFNVVKHAGVASAKLVVCRDGDHLRLTVSEQGCGFDPAAIWKMKETGFGLLSIRERVELLGGSLDIKSSPNKGASFSLTIPMARKKETRRWPL